MSEVYTVPTAPASITARDFDRIRKLAFEYCGLNIEAGKEDLVSARLGKIMRGLGIASYGDYFDYVVADKSQDALIIMIDSLTTNHTSFFREQQHFDFMARSIFPVLADRSKIDMWSAACSTGEEAYSVAFATMDFFGEHGPKPAILATDISTRVLDIAKKATYDAQRFQGIPVPLLQRYLLRGTGASSSLFRVKPEVRTLIDFRRLNLTLPFREVTQNFPLILCRNAMIYFNPTTQEQLVDRFFQQLEPGGYLFIGHSESLNRIEHRFDYVQPAVYKKPGTLGARSIKGDAA